MPIELRRIFLGPDNHVLSQPFTATTEAPEGFIPDGFGLYERRMVGAHVELHHLEDFPTVQAALASSYFLNLNL